MLASSSRHALRRAAHRQASTSTAIALDGRCLHTTAQSAYDDQPRRYRERDGDYNNNAPRRYNNQNGGNGIFSERRNDGRLRSQPFRQAPNTDFRGNNTGASIDRYNINIGDAVGRTQLSQALRLCAEMKAQRVIPNLTTYHHLLRGFADAAMYPESLAVLEDMERVGVQPDQLAYHFVMQSAVDKDMQAVWDIFHQMVAREIAPNELTYEILIKRHCAASNLEHALQAMVDLDSRGLGATLGSTQAVISLACELEQPRLALDIADAFTSNSVRRLVSDDWLKILTACAKDLWAEGVVRTWQEIVHTIGISPDEGTCMLVLNTAARHGLSALADDALRALRVIEVPWKEQHFAPLIAALARAGQLREAFGALELMRTAGVVPTTETAEPIFDAIRKSTDVVDDAWAALDEMHEQGRAIDALALTTIVRAAVALGDLQRAVGVYKGAGALGVTPDVHAYNALLEGCVAARHRELGDQLLAEMRTAEVSPTAETYLQLVLLCLTQVPYEHAFFYLEEMKAQGHVPPVIAYESLVRKCRAHEDPRWRLAAEEMRACGYEYSRVFQDVADELGGGRGEYREPEPEREPDLAGMGRRADRQTRQDEFAANVQTFLRADRRAK